MSSSLALLQLSGSRHLECKKHVISSTELLCLELNRGIQTESLDRKYRNTNKHSSGKKRANNGKQTVQYISIYIYI